MKKLILASAALLALNLGLVKADGTGCFGGFNMMGGYYSGSFMWIFGFVLWALVIVALILLIAWLMKQLQSRNKK